MSSESAEDGPHGDVGDGSPLSLECDGPAAVVVGGAMAVVELPVSKALDQSPFWLEMRELLKLAGPLVAAQLAQISLAVIDTAMAGRLGAVDLAAVSVGVSVWVPTCLLAMGVLLSISPLVAQAMGKGEPDQIGDHIWQGVWLALLVSLPGVLVLRNASPLFEWMRVDPRVIPAAAGYASGIAWGLPALALSTVVRGWHEGVGVTRPILWVSLIAIPCNALGNFLFMYGKFGLPRLGGAGCGLASGLVLWVMLAGLVVSLLSQRQSHAHGLLQPRSPRRAEMGKLFRLGLPIGLGLFAETLLFSAVTMFVARFGDAPTAGHQIALNAISVTFMVPLGISFAVAVRVGNAFGRSDLASARRAGFAGACCSTIFMSTAAIALFACPETIARLYTAEPDVLRWALPLLGVAALFQIFDGLQVIGAAALRGLNDTRASMAITLVSYLLIGLPAAWCFGIALEGGPTGLWIALILGLISSATLMNGRFLGMTVSQNNRGVPVTK